MKKEFNIFDDQCNNVCEGFKTLNGAIAWIKSNYTHKEWIDAELTLNEVEIDDNGTILEFTDQINPFE